MTQTPAPSSARKAAQDLLADLLKKVPPVLKAYEAELEEESDELEEALELHETLREVGEGYAELLGGDDGVSAYHTDGGGPKDD